MRSEIPEDTKTRFWSKTVRNGSCLEWTASTNRGGYGQFNAGGRRIVLAHRFAWEVTYGTIENNLLVCHTCDNRKCVEPTHLFLGSHLDNNSDMFSNGRGYVFDGSHMTGTKNPNAKLQQDDAERIKGMLERGASLGLLAKEFGVSKHAIYSIRYGKTWDHARARTVNANGPLTLERPSGENNKRAVLTWEKVRQMRQAREGGAKVVALSAQFGVCLSTVKQVISGATWRE
jgi:hypothetical protein